MNEPRYQPTQGPVKYNPKPMSEKLFEAPIPERPPFANSPSLRKNIFVNGIPLDESSPGALNTQLLSSGSSSSALIDQSYQPRPGKNTSTLLIALFSLFKFVSRSIQHSLLRPFISKSHRVDLLSITNTSSSCTGQRPTWISRRRITSSESPSSSFKYGKQLGWSRDVEPALRWRGFSTGTDS